MSTITMCEGLKAPSKKPKTEFMMFSFGKAQKAAGEKTGRLRKAKQPNPHKAMCAPLREKNHEMP
jgi:hypothetical protein